MQLANTSAPLIRIQQLTRLYTEGGQTRRVLNQVDLDIAQGEFFVMLGKSGSGKSTLLNLLSGIDRADGGRIWIGDTELTALDERRLTLFRRDHIGIVFQFFNLIPTLTVLENVMMPLELGGTRTDGRAKALTLLARVGLADRANAFPDKLSGGEQQRVAIARALIREPALVIADEPTGNLDDENGERVLRLLLELTREAGKTLVMATHNPDIVRYADRVGRLHDGSLAILPIDEKFMLSAEI
jgi:putative ABC transport system ATP-binding protein